MREKCDHQILELQQKHGRQMHRASEEASARLKGLEKDYQSQLKTTVSVGTGGSRQSPHVRTYVHQGTVWIQFFFSTVTHCGLLSLASQLSEIRM